MMTGQHPSNAREWAELIASQFEVPDAVDAIEEGVGRGITLSRTPTEAEPGDIADVLLAATFIEENDNASLSNGTATGLASTLRRLAAALRSTTPVSDGAELIQEAARLIKPSKGEAVFYVRVGGEYTQVRTFADQIEPERALTLAIDALGAERTDAAKCPAHKPPVSDGER